MRNMRARASVFVAAFSVMALAIAVAAQASFAAIKVEAKQFTEPIETSITENLPTVIGFIAAVFLAGFVIGWIIKRARQAKA